MKRYLSPIRGVALATMMILAVPAAAGPFADFEHALTSAYAPYRAALFQTNQKDRAGTEALLKAFESKWAALMATYRNAPPPQYADDAKWIETIAAIEKALVAAKVEAAKGELAAAHDVLEAIRVQLGALRARNGVIMLSDRVDAYHERMEHILAAQYGENLQRLCEDAAVLVHLAGQVREHPPAGLAKNPEFTELLGAMTSSADALLSAVRQADKAEIGKALKALKPAYARFFVKFG